MGSPIFPVHFCMFQLSPFWDYCFRHYMPHRYQTSQLNGLILNGILHIGGGKYLDQLSYIIRASPPIRCQLSMYCEVIILSYFNVSNLMDHIILFSSSVQIFLVHNPTSLDDLWPANTSSFRKMQNSPKAF